MPSRPAELPRVTTATEAVFGVLLAARGGTYGYEISTATGLKPGTVHPILKRWAEAGVLERFWEDRSSFEGSGRPPRRYYRFTEHGVTFARRALQLRARA